MFDTSVVRARAIAAPRSATLVASIAIHSIAVFAAVALTVTSTRMPADPPKQFELYRPVEMPSPPPAPFGVHHVGPPPPAVHVAKGRGATLAPPVIPDEVRTVPAATTTASFEPATTTDPGATGPAGDPNGVPGGEPNGLPGGTGIGTGVAAGPYTPGVGGVTPARVLTRVDPRFPEIMRHAVSSATVIVRCVIDRNGRIQDPEIEMSSFPPFNDSVLDALRRWTFAPGMAHGQPVDTYFELKVKFEVR